MSLSLLKFILKTTSWTFVSPLKLVEFSAHKIVRLSFFGVLLKNNFQCKATIKMSHINRTTKQNVRVSESRALIKSINIVFFFMGSHRMEKVFFNVMGFYKREVGTRVNEWMNEWKDSWEEDVKINDAEGWKIIFVGSSSLQLLLREPFELIEVLKLMNLYNQNE